MKNGKRGSFNLIPPVFLYYLLEIYMFGPKIQDLERPADWFLIIITPYM